MAQPVFGDPDAHRVVPRLGDAWLVLLARPEPDSAAGGDEPVRTPERQDLPRGAARTQPALHVRPGRLRRRRAWPVLASLRSDDPVRRRVDEAEWQHRAGCTDGDGDAGGVVLRISSAHP